MFEQNWISASRADPSWAWTRFYCGDRSLYFNRRTHGWLKKSPCHKWKLPVKKAKILVYGLPKSGKTSIINKLVEQVGHGASEEPPPPTRMFDVNRVQWNDVRLTIFDFSGKAECRRSLWKSYFDQADALVWVVDSTDRTHLDT